MFVCLKVNNMFVYSIYIYMYFICSYHNLAEHKDKYMTREACLLNWQKHNSLINMSALISMLYLKYPCICVYVCKHFYY